MTVILAILGYFVLKIEDIDMSRKPMREVVALFDNVAGLDEKAPVRVAGVRSGKVLLVVLENGKGKVIMEVNEGVQLRRGATARIANLGLLGDKYVEIDPGPPKAPLIAGETIQLAGSQPASIDDVTSQASAIAADVKAITESLRTVMAGPRGQQRLEDIVENVRLITAQVGQLVAANRENVDATMSNMRLITADLRVEIPKLSASIDRVANQLGGTVGENREDLRRIVENLRTLSTDLKTTTTNLNSITGQMKSGEGTVGKLLYSDDAHTQLTKALGSVESGVTELKNTLGRVGRIQLDLGVRSDYYAGMSKSSEGFENLGGTSRSAVTARLVPNAENNRFYNIELADDPRGRRRDKVVVETRTDPTTGASTNEIVTTTRFDRDFVVSAQAGWVLDDLAVRVGLFDSTGGVGADYRFNNRIRVSGEAFDFGGKRDDNPHVRLFGEYTIRQEKPHTPRLFVTSGVDNPLNDTAFIFGGGIRWRDDDLKYLLGSLPIGN